MPGLPTGRGAAWPQPGDPASPALPGCTAARLAGLPPWWPGCRPAPGGQPQAGASRSVGLQPAAPTGPCRYSTPGPAAGPGTGAVRPWPGRWLYGTAAATRQRLPPRPAARPGAWLAGAVGSLCLVGVAGLWHGPASTAATPARQQAPVPGAWRPRPGGWQYGPAGTPQGHRLRAAGTCGGGLGRSQAVVRPLASTAAQPRLPGPAPPVAGAWAASRRLGLAYRLAPRSPRTGSQATPHGRAHGGGRLPGTWVAVAAVRLLPTPKL